MKLDGTQLRQLQTALMRAFRNQKTLRQELALRLDIRLEEIVTGQSYVDIVYEVIDWMESRGRLDELIEAAREHNPGNPELQDFYERVWKPLEAQHTPVLSGRQIDRQTIEPDTAAVQSAPAIAIDGHRRRSRKSNAAKPTISGQAKEGKERETLFPGNTASRQKKQLAEEFASSAHRSVEEACAAVQVVIDLLRPENDVFSDQYDFAALLIGEASSTVEKIVVELAGVSFPDAPSRYVLEASMAFFCEESKRANLLLHQLSVQGFSLYLRKKVWYKLQRLLKILQELDGQIDVTGEHFFHN